MKFTKCLKYKDKPKTVLLTHKHVHIDLVHQFASYVNNQIQHVE
jgi:hypothetical protein